MACCFIVNWLVNFGLTRATPNMIDQMGWGVFMLYSMLTYLGVAFIFVCFPELKGRSIESMDDLFEKPLWQMWKRAYPTEQEKVRRDVAENINDNDMKSDMLHREDADEEQTQTQTAMNNQNTAART